MTKILVAGSSTVDLVFQSNALESRQIGHRWSLAHGGKYLVDNFNLFFGGGGANAAVTLTRHHIVTWLFSQAGTGYFGRLVLKNLSKHQIKTTVFIRRKPNHTPISAIIIDKTGDRTIFNYRAQADQLPFTRLLYQTINKVNWLAMFSLAKWPKPDKLKLLNLAYRQNKHIFLSLHGTEYKKGLLFLKDYFRLASIIHMNAYEMADLLGKKVDNINFYKTNLSRQLNVPLVLVTYDTKGSFAYTHDSIYYQSIYKPKKVVDTTGAGDAFASGFLARFSQSADIKKSLSFAARNAASVIEHYGAQNGILPA